MSAYLDAHPDIYFPNHAKEPHYFATDFDASNFRRFRRSESDYLSLFTGATTETILGEGSVHYLQSRVAAREIYEFNPSAKIVIMLRNPVDMLYSYHQRLLLSQCENIESFEDALTAEDARRIGQHIPPALYIGVEQLFYRDVVRFTEQIERYQVIFDNDAIKIILFDDFKADIAKIYRQTLEFLGVDSSFEPDFEVHNAAQVLRDPLFQRLISHPLLIKMGDRMPGIAMPVYRFLRRLNSKPQKAEAMSKDTRTYLLELLAGEITSLEQLLNRDLSHWRE
jgi:hypothetical protein